MASDDRMEESDSDWSDCPELEEEPDEATDALFAQYKGSPLDCLQADQSLLGWNLKSTGAKEQFEILDYIKAVNFIRSKSKTSELSKMSEAEFLGLRKTWQSEEYLKPANHMDAFLCFDWDDMEAPELVPTNQMVQNKSKLDELKKELGSISIPTGITKDESYFDGYSDYRNLLSNKIRFRIPERKNHFRPSIRFLKTPRNQNLQAHFVFFTSGLLLVPRSGLLHGVSFHFRSKPEIRVRKWSYAP